MPHDLSPKAPGNLGQPEKPEVTPSKPDCEQDWEYDEDDTCPRCGGEGWIMASDGDPSDWMEDTYCGEEDAVIQCRRCNGTGKLPERA